MLLFGAALLATFFTMQQYMSSQHAQHVSKGITRRHLPKTEDAVRSSASGMGTAKTKGDQQLRSKQQVKQPRTTGSKSANGGDERRCTTQEHAEYSGDVVKWGTDHMTVMSQHSRDCKLDVLWLS
jgi:hypothetical protein